MSGVRLPPLTGRITTKRTRAKESVMVPLSESNEMPTPIGRWCDLSGMTVLVTGASGGIGQAAAFALADCGADLHLMARGEVALEKSRVEIERRGGGGQVRTFCVDLTDTHRTRELIMSLPRVDALVNNAGLNIPQWLGDVDESSFETIFALNVKAAFFVAQACVAKFRQRGQGGVIVNVSSQMGHVGAARRTVYCASKHAIEGLTKAMAVELASERIRVNSVCPTFIETPMTAPMLADTQFRAEVQAKIPLGRVGTVAEVAGCIVFLLSPAASLMTGSSLRVDGGWTAQ
jgi:NAD(P)-dependent dehydrogenase (short-subunit alcohol dehydrogenase family)